MSKINILPDSLSNKIAAGEVVERPASVVKELIENGIDAGGAKIFVEVWESGRKLIRVSDNGEGMDAEDARRAFERHATSKLQTEADLGAIRTMGFRGEALPSIGAVSRVRMVTAPKGEPVANEIHIHGGVLIQRREAASPGGTLLEVEDLFYNMPARRKFLKSNPTELSHIVHMVQQQALAHPQIHFKLESNGRVLFDLPAVRNTRERTHQIIGPEAMKDLIDVSSESGGLRIEGLVSRPGFSRATRERQEFFLNGRAIKNLTVSHAVGEAYGTFLAKGRHPVAYLFLEMSPESVDVNVHPAKREVRFREPRLVHQVVRDALRERLRVEGVGYTTPSDRKSTRPSALRMVFEKGGLPPEQTSAFENLPDRIRETVEIYRTPGERPLLPNRETDRSAIITSSLPVHVAPLGQVDQTYIVAVVSSDYQPELHLLDQHAAHERLLYERLLSQVRASKIPLQPLLIPEVVEFSLDEAMRLREILPVLTRAGLEVEEFGEKSFRICAVPALMGPMEYRPLLGDILDDIEAGAMPASEEGLRNMLASMACHAAIKAHQALGQEQMTGLLEDLYRQEVPPTCPHGRPIRVRFSLADLEKMFQRR